MRDRVLLRFLLARELLTPAVDHVERLFKEEKWREAKDAIQKFALTLGVTMTGTHEPSVHVHTEWLSALDNEDKNVFMSLVHNLVAIADVVWPRAIGARGVRDFEVMRIEELFRLVRGDLHAVEEMRRDDSDAFKHGHFDIIPTKGVTDPSVAVQTLDEVSKHIQGKFPQVLYGKVYIRTGLRPSGTYDARPGSGGKIAGAYQAATDTVTLSMYATPERNSVMTLVHEFGHRFHTRFLKGDKREEFIKLHTEGEMVAFTRAERVKAADEYIELLKHHQNEDYPEPSTVLSPRTEQYHELFPRDVWKTNLVPLVKKFRDEKDNSVEPKLREALIYSVSSAPTEFPAVPEYLGHEKGVFASEYGRTSWEENFAESFLAFCMGKALPKPIQMFMESL